MMKFDAETTRTLENAYQGRDVVRRRQANIEALAPRAGQTIVDIGSGPGYMVAELARSVGDAGSVIGIDPSEDMRKSATRACAGFTNVQIIDGAATALPLPDVSVDGAASLQVFEYLDDVPAALKEVRRVLKPGGRLVIGDIHWDSWIWESDEPARMATMMAAWDRHLVDRTVPARLSPMLKAGGYELEAITPVIFVDHQFRPDGVARMLLHLIEAYTVQNELVEAPVVRAWAAEQHKRAADGRFFHSITHFVISARKV